MRPGRRSVSGFVAGVFSLSLAAAVISRDASDHAEGRSPRGRAERLPSIGEHDASSSGVAPRSARAPAPSSTARPANADVGAVDEARSDVQLPRITTPGGSEAGCPSSSERAGAPPSRVVGPVDWVLVQARATDGARVESINIGGVLERSAGALAVGLGSVHPTGDVRQVTVRSYGGRSVATSIEVKSPLVDDAVRVDLGVGRPEGTVAAFGLPGDLDPCETAALLVFVAGGSMRDLELSAKVARGHADFVVEHGTGSSMLDVLADDAIGLVAGPATVTTATASTDESVAIVGAVEASCTICVGSWTSPGGTQTDWESVVGARPRGEPVIAGPAGRWQWQWTSLTAVGIVEPPFEARPVVYAYAPIGSSWSLWQR